MLTLEQRLQVLTEARLPAASIVGDLAAALKYAESEEREHIALALLETGHEAGCATVMRHLHKLPGDVESGVRKALIADHSPAVTEAVQQVLCDRELRVQLKAVEIARQRGDVSLLPHLAALVDDSRDELPAEAAGAILALLTNHFGERGRGRVHEADRLMVDQVTADLLERATAHRQDDALIAVALAAQRARSPLLPLLEDATHPGTLALRRVVRLTDHPIVARNLIHWLARPLLSRPVLRWMHRVRNVEGFSNILEGGHLLLHPARRRAIRHVDRPMRCVPQLNEMVHLDDHVQHRLPDLIMALSLSTARKVRMLANGVVLPAPLARLRCVLALEGPAVMHVPQAMNALEQFLFDRDAAVATSAAWRRMGAADAVSYEALKHIESRANGAIATEATERLASSDAQRLCERVHRLPFTALLAAACKCLERDRDALISQFTLRLEGNDRSSRVRIIEIIRRLRLEDACASILLRCARDDDPHIAASAVGALARVDTQEVRLQLHAALRHDDARVRANSVEALADMTEEHEDEGRRSVFASAVKDESNRLRANAIHAMFKQEDPSGMHRLNDMLRDARPLHRISALWVARRIRCIDVAPAVQAIAQHDESAEIRTRAARAGRFLVSNDTRNAQSSTREAVYS